MDKPESLSVTAGDVAALEVKVCGTPELVPKWFKDGVELASGRKYAISFSRMISSLNVLAAGKLDSGEYTFQVMNEVGKDLSKINLTVLGWWHFLLCFESRFRRWLCVSPSLMFQFSRYVLVLFPSMCFKRGILR